MKNTIASKLDGIQASASVSGAEVAQLLDTSPETVSRWRGGKAQPRKGHLEHLLLLEWLIQELAELYEPSEARIWLFSPNGMLEGERPVDLIASGNKSLKRVLAVINQLKDGAFA